MLTPEASHAAHLAAFVSARLDELEARANAATPGPWRATGQDDHFVEQAPGAGGHIVAEMENCAEHPRMAEADAVHVACHDPARVLREVAAKRARLARWLAYDGYDLPDGVHDGRDPDERMRDEAVKDTLEEEVRQDAAVWSDHPDYQQEWVL